MVDVIGEHSARLPPPTSLHLIFVGDLIDRGRDSARVLEFLYDLQTRSDRVVVLLGNHEEAMLRALGGDLATLRGWLNVGGRDTLRSFGIDPPDPDDDMRDFLRRARSTIPRQWVQWMQRLPLTAQSGDYFFCHAGIRPGVPLRRQVREDLLWIRDDFLDDESEHGAVIVHGHSIEPTVQFRANRVGIDTGAYRTGRLSAVYLEGSHSEVLTVATEIQPA